MRRMKITGQDLMSGMMFTVIGGLGLFLGQDYRVGTALDMGPGYIPALLCWILVGLGLAICGKGVLTGGAAIARIHLRPLFFVIGGILLFALLLTPAGLLVTAASSVVLASLAAQDSRVREVIPLALGLSIAAALIFVIGLGLPIRLFPW